MADPPQTGTVTLWDLLTLVSFMIPVAAASEEAKLSHAGNVGYVLATLVGLAIGVCCAVSMRIALVGVGSYLARSNVSARAGAWYSGSTLIGAFVWMVLWIPAEDWLITKAVRFLAH